MIQWLRATVKVVTIKFNDNELKRLDLKHNDVVKCRIVEEGNEEESAMFSSSILSTHKFYS